MSLGYIQQLTVLVLKLVDIIGSKLPRWYDKNIITVVAIIIKHE